jgi:hypothetical protein
VRRGRKGQGERAQEAAAGGNQDGGDGAAMRLDERVPARMQECRGEDGKDH